MKPMTLGCENHYVCVRGRDGRYLEAVEQKKIRKSASVIRIRKHTYTHKTTNSPSLCKSLQFIFLGYLPFS